MSDKADAIVWNRDGVLTIPERMAYRRDARQLIVVTAKSLKSRSGTMRVYEYRSGDWVMLLSSPCRLGRNGLCAGPDRRRATTRRRPESGSCPASCSASTPPSRAVPSSTTDTSPSTTGGPPRRARATTPGSGAAGTWTASTSSTTGRPTSTRSRTGYNAKPNYSRVRARDRHLPPRVGRPGDGRVRVSPACDDAAGVPSDGSGETPRIRGGNHRR